MCRSIFETKCEADEAGVTRCGQEERRICAEDNCVLVEGEEQVNIVIVIIINTDHLTSYLITILLFLHRLVLRHEFILKI